MKTRVITGIIMAVIFVPIVIIGGIPFLLLGAICTAIASYELTKLYINDNSKQFLNFVTIPLSLMLYLIMLYINDYLLMYVIFVVIVNGVILVTIDNYDAGDFNALLMVIFYGALGISTAFYIRAYRLELFIFVLGISVCTDTFAYFTGVLFGKHKIAPITSPKKTIEGSVGGTLFAIAFAIIYSQFIDVLPALPIEITIVKVIFISLSISVFSQFGDLIASALKRYYKIKDFSNIFPGHGGVLDRFDSTMFACMTMLFILQLFELVVQ